MFFLAAVNVVLALALVALRIDTHDSARNTRRAELSIEVGAAQAATLVSLWSAL